MEFHGTFLGQKGYYMKFHITFKSSMELGSNTTWQHRAITWTNVDYWSVKSSDIYQRVISHDILQASITKISLKITYTKFPSNLPGANE